MADFELRYSPLFYEDLNEITDYLILELKNEVAAKALVSDTEMTIKKRLDNPLSTQPYRSVNNRKRDYRRILVGNYLIFYVVIGQAMTVRRMLYGRRDLHKIID